MTELNEQEIQKLADALQTIKESISRTASLKLIRNSRGYNWEIKILEIDPDKIEKANDLMLKKFGDQGVNTYD